MAKIEVKDIKLNGAELFDDSESFMDELHEDAVEELKGGMLVPTPGTKSIPTITSIPTVPITRPGTPVIL